jgi:hypothetical protein
MLRVRRPKYVPLCRLVLLWTHCFNTLIDGVKELQNLRLTVVALGDHKDLLLVTTGGFHHPYRMGGPGEGIVVGGHLHPRCADNGVCVRTSIEYFDNGLRIQFTISELQTEEE